ncbi:MAG: hypothetical protein LCI00_15810 [Chloroflexi bacterium]|nr:hypothetical protein [Chloroflexota bacterium]MCC6892694.1 hypothetical protein [Anaerolineae bacterium]
MTPKPKIDLERKKREVIVDDEWVEEEGRKLTDEEFQALLKNAPLGDPRSRPIEEVAAELELSFADDDEG